MRYDPSPCGGDDHRLRRDGEEVRHQQRAEFERKARQKRDQRGESGGHTGTPLEQWPQITRSQVKEAKYFECHTVEQMSNLSDAHCQKLGMGFQELRNKAKAYLAAAAGTADATAAAAENDRMRSELAEMKAQLAELSEKRSPGRPKKETAEA